MLALCLALVPFLTCAASAQTGGAGSGPPSGVSGLDTQSIDTAVSPQNDFYRFVNGK
jgi:hypothetical protein